MAYTQNLANFIPEVWSKQLLKNWDDTFVMGRLVNTGYEGEIKKFGDTVHVPYLGNITVSDYDNTAADPVAYEATPDYSDTLTVDQRKYWAFKVEDIEAAQADMDVRGQYTRRAAIAMKDTVESWLLGPAFYGAVGQVLDATAVAVRADSTAYALGDRVKLTSPNGFVYTCTTAGTSAATAPAFGTLLGATTADGTAVWTCSGYEGFGALTASNLYKTLVRAKKALRKANTWVEGEMWAVVPPEFEELILTSTELTHATDRADELLAQGLFGRLAGFTLYVSNNVAGAGSDADPYRILAGNADLVSFAEQITDTEAIRLESEFATGVRGLMVYGGKIFDRNKHAGIVIEAQV
jgi:hypothetical protein